MEVDSPVVLADSPLKVAEFQCSAIFSNKLKFEMPKHVEKSGSVWSSGGHFVSSWLFLTIYIESKLGQAIFSLCARWPAGFKQAESMAGWHTVPFQTKVCNFCCLTTIVAANILDIYWQNRIFHQFSIQQTHIYCHNPCNPCSYLQLKESM